MTAPRPAPWLAAGLVAVAALAPAAALAEVPTRPLAAVRSLHHIQDRIARGDASAFQVQSSTLRVIDTLLSSIDGEGLADPDQRRAVLAYAVSGGNPATFAGLYEALAARTAGDDKIVAQAVAAALFDKTVSDAPAADPLVIGGMLGAGLALLHGINAEAESDRVAYLEQVTLLAPGTLVEESALRRLMPLYAAAGRNDRFLNAASRYARAFVNSPYASDFAVSLVSGGVALGRPDQFARLADVIGFMPPAHRRSIVARQMRAATVDGNFELVRFLEARFAAEIAAPAARETAGRTPADPREALSQRLYYLMANIASADHAEVAAELAAIDESLLPAADRELLAVARKVIAEMTRPQDPAATAAVDAGPQPETDAADVQAAPVETDALGLPTQPAEDGESGESGAPGVRTVLPGYGSAAEPVAAVPEPAAPQPERAPAAAPPAADAAERAHQDFVSNARDMLRDVESVLQESDP